MNTNGKARCQDSLSSGAVTVKVWGPNSSPIMGRQGLEENHIVDACQQNGVLEEEWISPQNLKTEQLHPLTPTAKISSMLVVLGGGGWFLDQHQQHHPGTWEECRFQGPAPDLLNR